MTLLAQMNVIAAAVSVFALRAVRISPQCAPAMLDNDVYPFVILGSVDRGKLPKGRNVQKGAQIKKHGCATKLLKKRILYKNSQNENREDAQISLMGLLTSFIPLQEVAKHSFD